tara:strand:- start:881 stop:1144 length:264 start_codon:yes stop_codon:yes gene_type:complete
MKGFIGTFKKANGEDRTMKFVKARDLPESFLKENIRGTGAKKAVPDGFEIVWDIEKKQFKTFNWNSICGEVKQFELDAGLLYSLING